jgi:hypothetical protein
MKARMVVMIAMLSLMALVAAPAFGSTTVYDNGPINGSVDAWTINFGYAVTDSFTLASTTTITGFTFGVWAYPGDTAISVDYSIGTSSFDGTPTTTALSSSYLYTNQYGYDIDELTASGLNYQLGPGTYWFTLQNAVTTQGNPLYWDENGGAGCTGDDGNGGGCPSLAQQSSLGTIPSESFQIISVAETNTSSTTPEPGTIMLFGTGIIAAAGALKRKLRW